jgi:hypothetical protein
VFGLCHGQRSEGIHTLTLYSSYPFSSTGGNYPQHRHALGWKAVTALPFFPMFICTCCPSHSLFAHCTENWKQIFPKMKLCGLVPTFCIHISVSDLYIPKISPPTLLFAFVDRSWDYIHRSQIHECRNWERGRAVSFLGIFVSNFQYSVFAVHVNRLTIGSIPELGSSSPPCS